MEYRILGSLEVLRDADRVPLGGAKPKALLAVLMLNAGKVVSTDRLIDALWGEAPPDAAAHTLQVYVSQLRKALGSAAGGSVLETGGGGYLFRIEPEDEVDLQRFEWLSAEGRQALADGDHVGAAALLRDALALFRGPPLVDLEFEPFAQAEIARIESQRLAVLEGRIDADLVLGRHGEIAGELGALVTQHPLRERFRGQLMLALYRAGRQAEALQVYREGTRMLADELGIAPMPELQRLEQAILHQDPALDLIPEQALPRAEGAPPEIRPEPAASAPAEPRSERKFATVLFADLVASTEFASREDPEVVRSVVGRVFHRLVVEIERYGGVTEKFIGDAILAVFGVPAAHEDDPERAVRASLDMRLALSEVNGELAAEGRAEIEIRIGIEAGEVLVELDRVDGSRDRMLTGDTVNVAARLQAAAGPGQIVVGPSVRAAVTTAVELRALPPFDLKGKSEPVPAWEVVGVAAPHRERAGLGLRSKLVGRDEELAVLVQTFNRVEAEGRPALVTIVGSAGVGKSRLALELSEHLGALAGPPSWRKGRCVAYGNVSYSALAGVMKAECGVLEDDPPEVVADKSAGTVERLFGERDLAPLIEALVGSGVEHTFSREDLFDGWRRSLERMAHHGPLVVQLEDLHWADEGLLDFVDHVADWAEGPLLLLTLARQELLELRPGWGGGKRNYSAIYLDPLTPAETETLLEELLTVRLPETLGRLIVERSEGNPLFAEEVVRMLIDGGVLRAGAAAPWEVVDAPQEIDVPRSIQALMATRLDSLPPDEKAALQDASVVGRTFWLGAAQRLSGAGREGTKGLLARLRLKEILIQRDPPAFSGETEFAFRHELIRDAAYESLPKAMRAEKHVEVARWAEDQTGERRDEIAELLATHYTEALRYRVELGHPEVEGLRPDALRWARAAGERAARLWQAREAARWLGAAAGLAERIDLPTDERAAVWESYARAADGVEPYTMVAEAFERSLALYATGGSDADVGRIEAWLAHVAFQSGDQESVLRWAGLALEHLEPLGDSRDLALALVHLGWYHHRLGRDADAEPTLRRATEIAERVGDPVVRGRAMLSLGMLVSKSPRTEEGMALLDSALELARDAGDLPFLLWALLIVSEGVELVAGDYRRAEALVREGQELAARAGYVEQVAWMQGNLADYLVDQGRLEEAEAPARAGLEAARSTGELSRIGYSLLMLAHLQAIRTELEEAQRHIDEVRPVLAQITETYHEGWVALIEANIAWARGDEAAAIELLLDGARRSGDRLEAWAGQLLLLDCVRSLVRAGRAAEAEPLREGLSAMAARSVPTRAFLRWCDGLLEPEPAGARAVLVAAAEQLESLGRRVDHGRCLIDLAKAERALGEDDSSTLTRARQILEGCGATLFLREVEALERGTAPRRS